MAEKSIPKFVPIEGIATCAIRMLWAWFKKINLSSFEDASLNFSAFVKSSIRRRLLTRVNQDGGERNSFPSSKLIISCWEKMTVFSSSLLSYGHGARCTFNRDENPSFWSTGIFPQHTYGDCTDSFTWRFPMMSAFKCFSWRPRITACIRSSASISMSSALLASMHTSLMRLRQSVMSFSDAWESKDLCRMSRMIKDKRTLKWKMKRITRNTEQGSVIIWVKAL